MTPEDPLDDFDPNNRDRNAPEWATWCPGRYQAKFKVHANRGHATSALDHQRHGILYQWVDGRWSEICRRYNVYGYEDFVPTTCENCGVDVLIDTPNVHQRKFRPKTNDGKYVWDRGGNGKIKDPLKQLFLCRMCR